VVVGTTLGMMLANVPAVFFGEALTRRVPIKAVHRVAAVIFAALGVAVLLGWDKTSF
jgi:putative Ca2+/H+ antiporter (TMEM165/GDT1 family)